ncbi:MAG: helix-turn-helix domain-containing protein [Anaerolineae bacterium]|nr:helix-turn-helix domain-containing protein [Anaerolineae bacterium]
MPLQALLNIKKVAAFLGVSTATVYTWAQNGRLPAIKVGRSWRFRQSDLELWLDQNKQNVESDICTHCGRIDD